jgi:DNA processing protein
MIEKSENIFFAAFNASIDFSFQDYQLLIKKFNSLEKAYYAKREDLLESGLKAKKVSLFVTERRSFSFYSFLKKLKEEKINIVTIEESSYPFLLSKTYSPPPLLYYRGCLNVDWSRSLSVVGSRKISPYGLKLAGDIIPSLIRSDISIISGLALGVDSRAHQVSLDENGRTIAVLGSGLDWASVYPRRNKDLFNNIIDKGGLVFSEFPPFTEPLAVNFPRRNRVIAGLSPATLVLEASARSGSSITARYALEEGREVLAVPGSIYMENCQGTNNLIKSGAMLVSESEDVLGLYSLEKD